MLKPSPPKRIKVPRQVQSSITHQSQTVNLTTSANPVSETLQLSEQLLLHNETADASQCARTYGGISNTSCGRDCRDSQLDTKPLILENRSTEMIPFVRAFGATGLNMPTTSNLGYFIMSIQESQSIAAASDETIYVETI